MGAKKFDEMVPAASQPAGAVDLRAIDLDDASFRLSCGFDLEPLKASIRRVGLINPPVLRKRPDGCYQIVCGYRRIGALRELGVSSAACQLVPSETSDEACLLLSLYDNISHRELNPIEKSMALHRLLSYYGEEKIVRDFLPLLKLQPHTTQFRTYQPLCLLDKEIRDALLQDIIDVRTALRLAQLDPESRECLAQLLVDLRLSVSKQAEVITAVTEIGLQDGLSTSDVTGDPAVQSILAHDTLNRPQKGDAVLRLLREKRYPRLTAKEKQVKGALGKVKFPPGVAITPPPFFEEDRYCLSVCFTGWQELRERLDSLRTVITEELVPLE
jgi:ParB family chromosome partitioning protein